MGIFSFHIFIIKVEGTQIRREEIHRRFWQDLNPVINKISFNKSDSTWNFQLFLSFLLNQLSKCFLDFDCIQSILWYKEAPV